MPYRHESKETNRIRYFKSISRLCKATGLKSDTMYTVFGRKSLREYENRYCKIEKIEIE